MQRIPAIASLALGLSVALLILLAGPLLLFNPWFVSTLQSRHDVAAAFDAEPAEIDGVTAEILGDLFGGGDFDVALRGERLLDDAERSHMTDVSRLVRLLVAVALAALLVAAISGRSLRREPRRMATVLVAAAASVGILAVLLALVFAVAFEPAFLAFHAVFFPAGTYLFAPGSNLITLFPQGFWFDATLMAAATVTLSAIVVLLVGMSGRRSRPPRPLAPA